ncbi:M28 family peptidase [Pedobacter nutrimenti]|uniref:M28 family peptidase n=1 Tax=Pedobacter nutrimenti TaxID=1241337 RepID=UPI00292E2F70|nr:M28 family peptidase [Pedobacter nutrimenti]
MKKHFLYTSFVLFLGISTYAQNKTAVRFSQSITKDNAYKHLSVLASDEYEGRETGKKGAWMAADYIRNHFKSFGLKGPVNGDYFQPIDMVTYNLTQSIVTVNGEPRQVLKDFIIYPNNVSLNGFTFNKNSVLFAGYGLNREGYNDLEGLNLKGKVVMIFADGDPFKNEEKPADRAAMRKAMVAKQARLKNLLDLQASAVLLIDASWEKNRDQIKGSYNNGEGQPMLKTPELEARIKSQKTLPVISISPALANDLLKSGGVTIESLQKQIAETKKPASKEVEVSLCATAVKKEVKVRAENVLGFLEGSDPKLKKEILVVTGHYDHIGLTSSGPDKVNNGADDDGSGTTGVLMIAEAFSKAKKAGKGPKRSILFMTVVGEEKGLLGSEWYSEHPVFPLEKTITNLNIDMIGRVDPEHEKQPDYIYIIGSDMLSSDLDRIGKKTNADYVKMNLDMKYNNRTDPNQFYYRSDHYNFAKHNIPVIFYFNGVHADYHQPGDEVSKINFPLLARRAQLVYYTAWELANGLKRPVVDKNEDGTPKH